MHVFEKACISKHCCETNKTLLLIAQRQQANNILDLYGIMDVEYTWILWQGKNCCQFSLLTCNSFIGQFVHPLGGEG